MTKPKYIFPIRTKTGVVLDKPSTVEASTVGDRVTEPADLTVGRWYAIFTNATSPHTLLRAKYTGTNTVGAHVFKISPEDYDSIQAVTRELTRSNENIRTGKDMGGGTFGVYKFKQPVTTLPTVDQFKLDIDALRAKVEQKRDQIAKLAEEIAVINVAINDAKDKLKARLDGYI